MVPLALLAAVVAAALLLRNPVRTLWGIVGGTAVLFALAEFTGVRPAMAVAAVIAVGVALTGRRQVRGATPAVATDPDDPLARAWARLGRAGGFLARNRIVALQARYAAVAASTAECDPFSEAGELRLKLARYIPELIETTLDDWQRAPAGQRRAKLAGLLGELEAFVARMEAADPTRQARADRQKALRKHLGTGD